MEIANRALVQVGTRIYTNLYGRGRGVVYAIHGEQTPDSVQYLGGGVVATGGRADFGIVFEDGSESRRLPECILRGIQWRILSNEPPATLAEVEALRGHAILVQQQKQDEADVKKLERQRRIEQLRADPTFAHLEQGSDEYGGKLAAANIRRELKQALPGVKISVRRRYYGSVDVTFPHDAPEETRDRVMAVTDKYSSAHFDGMTDCEELHAGPWHVVFGGAKYISVQRDWR